MNVESCEKNIVRKESLYIMWKHQGSESTMVWMQRWIELKNKQTKNKPTKTITKKPT